MIYFVQQGNDGPVKIGYAAIVENRIRHLQVSSPYPLILLASSPGSTIDEKKIHAILKKHRLNGEWFEPHPEVFDFIKTQAIPKNEIDPNTNLDETLRRMETQMIMAALNDSGSQLEAAKLLNISYRSLRHRVYKYKIRQHGDDWTA